MQQQLATPYAMCTSFRGLQTVPIETNEKRQWPTHFRRCDLFVTYCSSHGPGWFDALYVYCPMTLATNSHCVPGRNRHLLLSSGYLPSTQCTKVHEDHDSERTSAPLCLYRCVHGHRADPDLCTRGPRLQSFFHTLVRNYTVHVFSLLIDKSSNVILPGQCQDLILYTEQLSSV